MRKHPCHDPTCRLDERPLEQQSASDEQIAREAADATRKELRQFWGAPHYMQNLVGYLTDRFLFAITRANKARDEQSAPAAEQEICQRCGTRLDDSDDALYCGQCIGVELPHFGPPSPAQEKRGDWSLEEMYGRMLVAAGVVGLTHDEAVAETKRLCDLARAAQEKPVEAILEALITKAHQERNDTNDSGRNKYVNGRRDALLELRTALATASPSEDTKRLDWARERLQELRDNTAIQRGSDDDPLVSFDRKSFIEELDRVLAAMSSPSVTQTESSLSATTLVAQERQCQETGDAT